MPKALVVDDEADIRNLIALSLDRIGIATQTAANLEDARALVTNENFDVCLTDMRLPDGDGLDLVKFVQRIKPELPIAVITAHGSVDSAVGAMKSGAFDFVSKPIDLKLLRTMVTDAIKRTHVNGVGDSEQLLPNENDSNKHSSAPTLETLSGRNNDSEANLIKNSAARLVGSSQKIQNLRKLIGKATRTQAAVCITGEPGTGKERIARWIHENGPRADKPFVTVDCSAIVQETIDEEFSGLSKSGFSKSITEISDRIKEAEGGTLFLNDVHALPIVAQDNLNRLFLINPPSQTTTNDSSPISIRLITASSKSLEKEVIEERFRHGLFYQLNIIRVTVPALRERSDDIIDTASHLIDTLQNHTEHTDSVELSADARIALQSYPFLGNIHELESMIARALALASSNTIELDDLAIDKELIAATPELNTLDNSLKEHQQLERKSIEKALTQTRWNRKAASEKLGLSYRQLRYRITQYGLNQPAEDDD